MPKQVSITKKFLESTPYNDSSTYLVDTKATRKPAQATPPSFVNVIEDCTSYEFCPKMKLKKMKLGKKFDLRKYAGVAEVIDFRLKKAFLEKNYENIIWDNSDLNTGDNAVLLSKDCYDGVKYFAKADTLSIPVSIKSYLSNHDYIDVKCIVYNYPEKKVDREEFSSCQNKIEMPPLSFKGLPEEINYNVFESSYYHFGSNDSLLYINLPLEYYSKIKVDNEFLAYNVNEGYYVGHSNCCEAKMNHLCYDVAKNGIQKPVQFFLSDKGCLVPAWSNKRILSALYLQLPEIPAIIISNSIRVDPRTIYKESGDCTELLNKYLSPYFITA